MDGMSIDLVITDLGAERIIRMAFEYAKQNDKRKSVADEIDIVKATDGRFLKLP